MPKLKTRKSIAKRFRVTKKRKLIKITSGRDHFNARESGNTTRNKRRPSQLSKTFARNVKEQLPYC